MNLGGVGIFLWLAVFNFGEDILSTTKFERTYWAFNTVEECVEFGDNSNWIANKIYSEDGIDWLFAICLDPGTADRGYILPTYESGETPVDIQMIIMNFETVMTEDIIPEVLGIPFEEIPPKTVIFKSWD
tara:strand:+ start:1208 stop:1597 length:390 start_codon:yes stop_codon:yes gene_type:complete